MPDYSSRHPSIVDTGSVLFTIDGQNVASVPVDATGKATFTTHTLTPGSHSVSALYPGGIFDSSDSSGRLTQEIT